jgi:hypothetical protein
MPDDLTKRGPHDRNRVSKQPHEQAYQKRKLPESTLVRREKSEILLKAARRGFLVAGRRLPG